MILKSGCAKTKKASGELAGCLLEIFPARKRFGVYA
jgi:hypothetical protein